MSITNKRSCYQFRTAAGSLNLLSGVALNAAAASRTVDVQMATPGSPAHAPTFAYDSVTFDVQYTFGTATQVNIACFSSNDAGLTYSPIQAQDLTNGADTFTDYLPKKATGGASMSFSFYLPNRNYTNIRVVFSGTGAGAGDLITVKANAGSW